MQKYICFTIFILISTSLMSQYNNNLHYITDDSLQKEKLIYQDSIEKNIKSSNMYEAINENDIIYSFAEVDEKPEYPGGDAAMLLFISYNLFYPKTTKEDKLQTRVYVQFVIDKNGKLKDIETVKSVGTLLDQEFVRVVSLMPNWKPGKCNGEAVKVKYMLPVNVDFK